MERGGLKAQPSLSLRRLGDDLEHTLEPLPEQLLEAVQEQLGLEEGDLRVLTLESQPIQVQRQRYRIFDARTGLIEEGLVEVSDMLERLPWLDENWGDFPVEITYRAASAEAGKEPTASSAAPA